MSALDAPRPIVAGVAALATASLALGTHSISATYSGDGSNSAGTSNAVSHTVMPLGSGVILSSSANPAAPGFPIVLTAVVTGNNPGGSVVFRAGSTDLATVALAAGVAATSVANLPAGNHLLVAAYSGDGTNAAATSTAVLQQIVAPTGGLAPSPFAFAARGNVAPSSAVTSSAITVAGIGAPVPILVSGGTYSIGCSGTYVSLSGIVAAGQSVCVRHTSAAAQGAATTTTLTIGGVSATFTSTTYTAAFQAAVTTLATHYYSSILRRTPDSGGQAFWSSEAMRVAGQGANVAEAFYAMAMSFFTSAEYLAFNRNNSGFVTDLYTTFFSRAPDTAGLAYWQGLVDQGMPREVALAGFMFSPEFANLMQATFGNSSARAEVDAVMDFYRGLLVRLPDDGGLDFWVARFRAAQCGGQAAVVAEVESISSAFALSPEYLGRNRTSAQYVGDLYNAFLRRGGDLGGVQFWIGQVSSGAQTREQVRAQFKNSPEFQARVQAIIAQGCP